MHGSYFYFVQEPQNRHHQSYNYFMMQDSIIYRWQSKHGK